LTIRRHSQLMHVPKQQSIRGKYKNLTVYNSV